MKIEFPKHSSVANRPTVGSQVYEVLKKNSGNRSDIEAGDLGREVGKQYMRELSELIENNGFQKNPYYVWVVRKKDVTSPNIVKFGMVARWTRPHPEPDCDLWLVKDGKPELQWSLPGNAEMDMIMKMGKDFDQKLVNWILEYRTGKLQ